MFLCIVYEFLWNYLVSAPLAENLKNWQSIYESVNPEIHKIPRIILMTDEPKFIDRTKVHI